MPNIISAVVSLCLLHASIIVVLYILIIMLASLYCIVMLLLW